MIRPKKDITTLIQLERVRRSTVTGFQTGPRLRNSDGDWANQKPSTPHLHFQSVHFFKLFRLYKSALPRELSSLLMQLSQQELSALDDVGYSTCIASDFIASNNFGLSSNSGQWQQLESEHNSKFRKLLQKKELLKYNLLECADTLHYVCTYFYNQLWDIHGIDFDGPIQDYSLEELTHEGLPHFYRHEKQLQVISKIIYNYYLKEDDIYTLSLSITFSGNEIPIDDPIYSRWAVRCLIDSIKQKTYPSGLGKNADTLSRLLTAKELYPSKDAFLNELLKFTKLDPEGLIPMDKSRRAIVKKFCTAIHPIFSEAMQLPVKPYKAEQLRLYNDILKLYSMDDFSQSKNQATEGDSIPLAKKRCGISNRLGALLKDNKYPSLEFVTPT